MTDLPKNVERELAALADGSLTSELQAAAQERVSASRELSDALAEQRHTIELLAAVDVQAPVSLHGKLEQMSKPASSARLERLRLRRIGLAAAAAAAIAAGAIAIGVSGGGSSGLSVRQAAALALRPATMPAPSESSANRSQLKAAVGGVTFPYWKERFGWRSSGARTDLVAGRSVTTVFYSNAAGRRIGYAIVSGRAPKARDGRIVSRWGVHYRVLSQGGATVVTWERDGRLCVVAGRGVSAHTLLGLASWGSERARA
jgi:hypothetical protein